MRCTTRLPALASLTTSALVLLAAVADQHLPRLAAREVDDFGRDAIIDDDDVGALQCANGAQREQIRDLRRWRPEA